MREVGLIMKKLGEYKGPTPQCNLKTYFRSVRFGYVSPIYMMLLFVYAFSLFLLFLEFSIHLLFKTRKHVIRKW